MLLHSSVSGNYKFLEYHSEVRTLTEPTGGQVWCRVNGDLKTVLEEFVFLVYKNIEQKVKNYTFISEWQFFFSLFTLLSTKSSSESELKIN